MTPVLKGGKTVIPDQAIQSVRKNTVALKGGTSFFSLFISTNFFLSFRTARYTQYVTLCS